MFTKMPKGFWSKKKNLDYAILGLNSSRDGPSTDFRALDTGPFGYGALNLYKNPFDCHGTLRDEIPSKIELHH